MGRRGSLWTYPGALPLCWAALSKILNSPTSNRIESGPSGRGGTETAPQRAHVQAQLANLSRIPPLLLRSHHRRPAPLHTCRSDRQAGFPHRASSCSTGHREATVSASCMGTATARLSPSCRAAMRLEPRTRRSEPKAVRTAQTPRGPAGRGAGAALMITTLPSAERTAPRSLQGACTPGPWAHLSLSSAVFLGSFIASYQSTTEMHRLSSSVSQGHVGESHRGATWWATQRASKGQGVPPSMARLCPHARLALPPSTDSFESRALSGSTA